jgi:hypothetical protein
MTFNRLWGFLTGLLSLALLLGVLAQPGTSVQAQSEASITVQPETAPQSSTITLLLSGFRPEESVNIWQTLPDFSVANLGNFDMDETGAASVSVFVDSNTPTGTHAFTARGNESLRQDTAFFELTLGEGAAPDTVVQIQVRSDVEGQGGTFAFSGSGFDPNEGIALWINLPDNTVEGLGTIRANAEGVFQYELTLGGDYPAGIYQLTAYGLDSDLTGIVTFQLLPGSATGEPAGRPDPVLVVRPADVVQFETVTIEGQNFGRDEDVSLWVTLQNGSVAPLVEGVDTTDDGFFAFEYQLGQFPVGTHTITAQGQSSRLIATTTLVVRPGVGPEN